MFLPRYKSNHIILLLKRISKDELWTRLLRWGILQPCPQFTSLTLAPFPTYEPLPQPHQIKSP